MPIWPFVRSRADSDAARLLAAVTAASRRNAFFGAGRAPDTLEWRFELMTLSASLALMRLGAEPSLAPLAQSFADQLFAQFDAGLREDGVGDTAVPKRMRRLAGAFYGRLDAYAAALACGDEAGLTAAIGRNVLAAETHPFAPALAAYARRVAAYQAANPHQALFSADGWPAPPN